MSEPLVLASAGRASDAAFLAAADLAAIAATLDVPYRLIGGNAVSLLVAAHGVENLVPARETADADFGAEPSVIADPRLLSTLSDSGYRRSEGNRFVRRHTLPADGGGPAPTWDLVVDVLAPSYQGRLLTNRPHGELVVDEIPGLHLALARPGKDITVHVRLTSGHVLDTTLVVPDVVSAICLKANAYDGRFSERDAVDLWRLLEAARAGGISAATWPTGPTTVEAAALLRQHLGRPGAGGLERVSHRPADRTRVRALVAHVVGTGAA